MCHKPAYSPTGEDAPVKCLQLLLPRFSSMRVINDNSIEYIITSCNRVVKQNVEFAYESQSILICALNKGNTVLDFIYTRYCKIYNGMASMIIRM